MIRGKNIYYNTGELSFETNPQSAGTFKGVFLEEMSDHDACGNKYSKIINKDGRIQVVANSLLSNFNI